MSDGDAHQTQHDDRDGHTVREHDLSVLQGGRGMNTNVPPFKELFTRKQRMILLGFLGPFLLIAKLTILYAIYVAVVHPALPI